jgi:Methyltransferase domain
MLQFVSSQLSQFRGALVIPVIRESVGRIRLWYYLVLKNQLRTVTSKYAFELTRMHNLKLLKDFTNVRMDILIKPLSVLEFLNHDSNILVIGPRNENDLLRLLANGFSRSCIRGLDLMSYSPLIDVGDMHETPYEDNRWDAIICGWTLSYSRNPELVSKELIRIAKDGCAIAIAVEYSTLSYEEGVQLVGYSVEDKGFDRVNSVDRILQLFQGHVGHVYFSHDAPLKRHHTAAGLVKRPSSVAVIFTVKKNQDSQSKRCGVEKTPT